MLDTVKSPRMASLINKKLQERDMTRSDFVRDYQKKYKTGSRNHIFKILNGQAVIGENNFLPRVCELLGIEYDDALKLVRADKIDLKDWAGSLSAPDEITKQLMSVVGALSKKQKQLVLQFAKDMAQI